LRISPRHELLDRAVVRLTLLLASDDDRVALRASIEVHDRVLGQAKACEEHGFERDFAAEAESTARNSPRCSTAQPLHSLTA
jgi:hypothetical protein